MRKFFILSFLFLILNACGFTSVYKNSNLVNNKINFNIVNKEGDKEINNYIINRLDQSKDTSLVEKIEINISSNYSKSVVAKNKKGEATIYLLSVKVNFEITDNDHKNEYSLKQDMKINKLTNNFQQKNYETKMKKEISKSITDQLLNKIFSLNDN